MSALEEFFPVFVKSTLFDFEEDSLQAARRCAHQHHDRAAWHPKPLDYDVSCSTRYASPRGSLADDPGPDKGSRSGSESEDFSLSIHNIPSLPLDFDRTCKPQSYRSPAQLGNVNSMSQSGLHQKNNTLGDRISIYDALQTSLQQVVVSQSKREFIMTSGTSAFGHEAGTTRSAEFCSRHQKQTETSQGVGRSKKYEKPPLKGRNCNAAPRTLMICNLPCRLGYDDLIEAINTVGFGDAFEFVHLACRYKQGSQGSNLGYAFINFFSPTDAALFASAFEGYHFSHKGSTKVCSVRIAKFQGFNGRKRFMQRNLPIA